MRLRDQWRWGPVARPVLGMSLSPEGSAAVAAQPAVVAWGAAVLIGVPMYTNAAGVIPIVQALLAKGAALGTVLAFMMAVIALLVRLDSPGPIIFNFYKNITSSS